MYGLVISDRLWEIMKWPLIVVGLLFVIALWVGIFLGMRWLVRKIRQRLSKPEFVALAVWGIAIFALSLAATLVIVHRAVALAPSGHLTNHFLVVWAVTWGGSMLLVSILAGMFVFRRATPWQVVLTWPWLVGGAVGLAWMVGLSGQMDAGSKLCDAQANGSCDNAWGLGAILLSVAAALVLGGTFVFTATLRRMLPRLRR